MSETPNRQTLPPGPRWPDPVQALLLMRNRPTVMQRLQRRYGDVFTVRMPYGPHGSMVTVVALADPGLIREVFAGSTDVFHAGEGNSSLLDVMGEHSLLLLDEGQHVRAKKLLMPAFTGQAMHGYRGMVAELALSEVEKWRPRQTIVANRRMQAITLEIILRVIFGVTDARQSDEIRPLVTRIANLDLVALLAWRIPSLKRVPPWREYARAQTRLDECLYSQIDERRRDPHLLEREDLLSRLLRPTTDGDTLTDAELRDQLVTFLLAGHETTATALAWTLHELAHRPDVQRSAQSAAQKGDVDGDAYLEAVVKETMRLRPVVFQATRTLTRSVELGGYTLPAGVVVSPALGLMGTHVSHHLAPGEFDPNRFLDQSPAPNTWIPFGGGPRRCIGATFSLMEAVEILRVILTRYTLTPENSDGDVLKPRGIINAPHRGAVLRLSGQSQRV